MLKKINPDRDNFRIIFDKYSFNFEYLESLIKETSVRRNYERFQLRDTGQLLRLKRPYTLNNNSIDLYIDGVRQHPHNFVEVNPYTIQLVDRIYDAQIADVYYKESFELDSTRRDSELAPIFTLSHELNVEIVRGVRTIHQFDKKLYIPSDCKLWRVIISPEYKVTSGSLSLKLSKDKSITLNLSDNSNSASVHTINPETGIHIIEFSNENQWEVRPSYSIGDEITLIESVDNIFPLQNKFIITYVLKLTTSEVTR